MPPDDLNRILALSRGDGRHFSVAGDTYTILISGQDTGGRLCVVDMHVPHGGGPPPHRHDFEETFVLLEGEIEVTFRGETITVPAGASINIPANAPHHFRNSAAAPARLLCICSPAGLDSYFVETGTPVATRTAQPPDLDPHQRKQLMERMIALAPKYRTEILFS